MIDAMKQALEALEELMPTGAATLHLRENAITTLRQAIAEAERESTLREISDIGQEAHTDHPMRHWDRTCPACVAEADKQEPVAWMTDGAERIRVGADRVTTWRDGNGNITMQEPVAYGYFAEGKLKAIEIGEPATAFGENKAVPLYTAPPKREWVCKKCGEQDVD